MRAYRNAEAVTLLRRATGGANCNTLLLTASGRPESISPHLRQLLDTYFGCPIRNHDRLPEELARWVRHQETLLVTQGDAPSAPTPLVVEHDGRRLTVRFFPGPSQRLLLFEERQTAPNFGILEELGVTRRQADILGWVAQGKTNDEIATILAISPRTVAKHLEMMYPKLGVENRTAAAARALSVLQEGPVEQP
jgi:DNA-binding CsgD family transcriptional regulator